MYMIYKVDGKIAAVVAHLVQHRAHDSEVAAHSKLSFRPLFFLHNYITISSVLLLSLILCLTPFTLLSFTIYICVSLVNCELVEKMLFLVVKGSDVNGYSKSLLLIRAYV